MQKKKDVAARLTTGWGRELLRQNNEKEVLCEYPRPSMVRKEWQCLNGLWEYALRKEKKHPQDFDGKILVPFSPETRLSGVEKQLLPDMFLWYERRVELTGQMAERLAQGGRLLLHFGAVDQSCEVFVNGHKAGSHVGGYLPFTMDITAFVEQVKDASLSKIQEFRLSIRVRDVSDTSWHSVGKQTLKPGGMYYQATGGIWQTVWLEAVPKVCIKELFWEAEYDESRIRIEARIEGSDAKAEDYFVKLVFKNAGYEEKMLPVGEAVSVELMGFKSWSPEEPFLYEVCYMLYRKEASGPVCCDSIESYFAMRKCSIGTDKDGIRRIFLNNRPYMQTGVLDQGYWPESMYTAPCEEALLYDIKTMKDLGFNMLRKHVKVEPERFYYHCDKLGMLVWQDMVNGGRKNKSFYVTYLATLFQLLGIRPGDNHRILLSRQDKQGRLEYEAELKELVQRMKAHPSVVCIVPFNEGWGQFDTNRMTALVKQLNKSIIVDQASGWFDMGGGDVKSLHHYFFKFRYRPEKVRALALTEFGGYARRIEGHTCHEKEYGYKTFSAKEALEEGYESLLKEVVLPAVEAGVSVTVYTQLSDVEEEINGILTYDREVLKMDADLLRKWNKRLRDMV